MSKNKTLKKRPKINGKYVNALGQVPKEIVNISVPKEDNSRISVLKQETEGLNKDLDESSVMPKELKLGRPKIREIHNKKLPKEEYSVK